ncbi:MAG: feruloyl-CoA synthase, partial [Bacteroidetes bacterium]|nr:feruloyl-CoA synthase [Bacteroidota bacterium]
MHFKEAPFLEIPTQKIDIKKRTAADGAIYLKSWMPLESHPYRMTERLVFWAEHKPETVFLGQRNDEGEWQTITYAQTLNKVRNLAQWLLNQKVSVEKPVAIIAENS